MYDSLYTYMWKRLLDKAIRSSQNFLLISVLMWSITFVFILSADDPSVYVFLVMLVLLVWVRLIAKYILVLKSTWLTKL